MENWLCFFLLLLFLWLLLTFRTFIFTLNVFSIYTVILTFYFYWSHRSMMNNQCTCHYEKKYFYACAWWWFYKRPKHVVPQTIKYNLIVVHTVHHVCITCYCPTLMHHPMYTIPHMNYRSNTFRCSLKLSSGAPFNCKFFETHKTCGKQVLVNIWCVSKNL